MRFSGCCGVATRNNVISDSTSFFEPASRPRVFRCKDGEPYRDDYERRSWQNQQGDADQQDGCSPHGNDYTPHNLDVFNIQNAEEAFHPTWKIGRPFHLQSAVSSHRPPQSNWIGLWEEGK